MKTPELLLPAGNLEALKTAFTYGADAVYLAGKKYGLRAKADNFTLDDIKEGVKYAHNFGKKVYVALNIIAHNSDFEGINSYIKDLIQIGVDSVIVSDPGIISEVRDINDSFPIHLSTQANNTNFKSANFWHMQGIKRITLARELSLHEIVKIRENTPEGLELEVFIHGSVCISYSGRCMLSKYMAGRDANLGDCSHPCRWKYSLSEEKRPGEYFPVFEDNKGTHIFNSKDLCLIEHLPKLIDAGISSFKIEGRMKSSYYVAVVTSVYRQVIDEYLKGPKNYKFDTSLLDELKKVNNREYSSGFLFSEPNSSEYTYDSSGYTNTYSYLGLILDYDNSSKLALVRQQNKMVVGDEIEVIGPKRKYFTQKAVHMTDEDENSIDSTPHPQQLFKLKMENPVKPFDMIRKKVVTKT